MPLVVDGSHFRPGERVQLRVRLGENVQNKDVVASDAGAFRVTFDVGAIDVCRVSGVITATGAGGSRARAFLAECPSRPRPDHPGEKPSKIFQLRRVAIGVGNARADATAGFSPSRKNVRVRSSTAGLPASTRFTS